MKLTGFLLCLLFPFCTVFAQNNSKPGWIIKLNGDTVRGYIQSAVEEELAEQVHFKADSLSPFQTSSPADILSFKSGNNIFESATFRNPTGDSVVTDTCFIKQLVTGKYNLYSFIRKEMPYFIIRSDTTIYFLYNTITDDEGVWTKPGDYLNILNLISISCDKLATVYERVGYSEKALSAFVLKLNNCIAPGTAKSFYQKPKTKVELMAFVGGLPLGRQSQFTANLTVRFSSPSISRKVSLNAGFEYSHSVVLTNLKWYGMSNEWLTMHRIFSIPLNFQYYFINGRIRPYAYAGFSLSSYRSNEGGSQSNGNGFQSSFGLSLVAGIGVEARIIKNLYAKVDYRYEMLLQFPAIGIAYQFE